MQTWRILMRNRAGLFVLSLAAFCFSGQLNADIFSLSATDSGFVTEMGGSAKGDGTLTAPATFNYSVGQEEHYFDGALGSALAFMDRKNYFVFDLSSVTDPIASAKLKLWMGPDEPPAFPGGMHGYESLDPSELFAVLETTDPTMALGIAGDLLVGNMSGGPGAFDSATDPLVMAAKDLYSILGDGAPLATITTTSADNDTFLMIDFTPAGIAYLNMFLGGEVILAGELPTIDGVDTTELIFGFTGPDISGGTEPAKIPMLELTTVPEPASGILLALGIGIFLVHRRSAGK
jgi:hypothetical protein